MLSFNCFGYYKINSDWAVTTILFETIIAARKAYDILQAMTEVNLDCNAITYDRTDEKTVKWLIQDSYCQVGTKRTLNPKQTLILLVDDDSNLLLLLTNYLDYKGLESLAAESYEEGWELYCKNKPSAIVSGIAMQSTDCGYRLFQRVREHDSHQPFIFLSSQLNDPDKRERAMELGANAYISKPFYLEELLTTIETLLPRS